MEQKDLSAEELRAAAQYVREEALEALDSYSDISFPLAIGDLRRFPRESPQDQAAEQGFDVLRRSIEGTVDALYALAAAVEAEREVPPVLLAPVQPFIDAFRARRGGDAAG